LLKNYLKKNIILYIYIYTMYKINVFYENDSIYTKEEETTASLSQAKDLQLIKLGNWIKKLCPYLNWEAMFAFLLNNHIIKPNYDTEEKCDFALKLLNHNLAFMNSFDGGNRKIAINIEPV